MTRSNLGKKHSKGKKVVKVPTEDNNSPLPSPLNKLKISRVVFRFAYSWRCLKPAGPTHAVS